MKTLEQVLSEHGIDITPDFTVDKSRNGPQWLFCRQYTVDGVVLQFAWFGDYSRDIKGEWQGSASPIAPGKLEGAKLRAAKDYQEEKEAGYLAARESAKEFLRLDCTQGSGACTAYLRRKQIELAPKSLLHVDERNRAVIIVPMQDTEGEVWNYQRIYPEKFDQGDKFFATGARIRGLFFQIGEIASKDGAIYICEGYATAVSVRAAMGDLSMVVAAFNAGNLESVATSLRQKYPKAKIVICADNDQFPNTKGVVGNVGLDKGQKAARQVAGICVFPTFDHSLFPQRPTDFNDLHIEKGPQEVKRQIEVGMTSVQNTTPEPEVIDLYSKKTGKPIKPPEKLVATQFLRLEGERLVKEDQDLWRYETTHWKLLDSGRIDRIKSKILEIGGPMYTVRDALGVFNHVKIKLEPVPEGISLFACNRSKANFKNGTLHFTEQVDGKYIFELKPHNPEDFISHVLPFDYAPTSERNQMFEDMLDRIWANDPDIEAKKNLYFEFLGASLISFAPQILFLVGHSGSGKSTLLYLMQKLLTPEHVCKVDPTMFEGFNLEGMINKRLNVVTDIELHKPLSESIIRQLIDKGTQHIRRKHHKDIYGFLPPIHAFGMNNLPRTKDGKYQAYDRRIKILRCVGFLAEDGQYSKTFDEQVWKFGPQGILNRALEGLARLAANGGFYTNPESAKTEMKDWQTEGIELVDQFLAEAKDEEEGDKSVQTLLVQGAKIERKTLWVRFNSWFEESHNKKSWLTKQKFYSAMALRGYGVVIDGGVRKFKDVTVARGSSAKM